MRHEGGRSILRKGIFISYAKEDRDFAEKLYERLAALYYSVWLDSKSLQAGDSWKLKVEEAISDSRYFVAIISRSSVDKIGYVQKELKEALSILDLYPESQRYILPIRIDESEPSSRRLKDIHYVDMFPDFEVGFVQLVSAIEFQPGTAPCESIEDTAWLYMDDDEDNDTCDEIQFFADGTTRFKEISSQTYIGHPYPHLTCSIYTGNWVQNGNGITFTVTTNGPALKGFIEDGEIRYVGAPHFGASIIGKTNKDRIGIEGSYDENNVCSGEFEIHETSLWRKLEH